jgi:hypothetical protein
MFVDELRRAVVASPRAALSNVNQLLWRAFAAGQVTEDQASELSEMIEVRKAIPAVQKTARRRVGSRPRSSASMERRRRWAASGALPPALAARFTLAETAVLAVVAAEHRRHGACTLTVGHIAALAGVCGQTVRNALKHAQALVRVEQRRVTAFRNMPNRVTIISREWLAWMQLRGGSKSVEGTPTQSNHPAPAQRNGGLATKQAQAVVAAPHVLRPRDRNRSGSGGDEKGRPEDHPLVVRSGGRVRRFVGPLPSRR